MIEITIDHPIGMLYEEVIDCARGLIPIETGIWYHLDSDGSHITVHANIPVNFNYLVENDKFHFISQSKVKVTIEKVWL